ncbi:MAG TPA: 30S ribosomal protein S17 [Candidatus Babeliales bacterium]|nr:30S ribosomal protein S17 [Candidatus Babeliales bacterium]
MTQTKETKRKVFIGKVISDKMDKTVTVLTERTFMHPVFHKVVRVSKKYKVHDETEVAKMGDMVAFYEGRPVSKTKYMYLSHVLDAATIQAK